MEIQANAAMMIQANSLEAIRTTLSAAQAAPATQEAQAAVILELSTAAQQLLTHLALATPPAGCIPPAKTRARTLMYQPARCESLPHHVGL